ncbi:phosphoribosylanthranilate isomerase [Paenibacillus sp. CAU 1782]
MTSRGTRIKICGLKDAATIAQMDGLPIHEIGFVFAPSKRRVSAEEAALLIQSVYGISGAGGAAPRTVGVFVNASLSELDGILDIAPLDVVQLHGDETPQYCRELKTRHPDISVWRVISIKETAAGDGAVQGNAEKKLLPYQGAIDACLIDAPGGGTGQPFNWMVIEEYKEAAKQAGVPLYVAGGLREETVEELLRKYNPDGIDVSSGVETDGAKDIDKIRAFVRKVIQS